MNTIKKLLFVLILLAGVAVAGDCPVTVQCAIDGQYMMKEETYVNGIHRSIKYGHLYYGPNGTEHHTIVVQCE